MNIYLLFTKTKGIGNLLPFRTGCVLLLAALTSHTQGQVNYDEAKDKGPEAVVRANQTIKSEIPTVGASAEEQTVKNVLNKKLKDGGIRLSWDEEMNRLGGVALYRIQVGSNIDLEQYFIFRQVATLGALLEAQAQMANWLGAEASMDVCMKLPGDPFFSDTSKNQVKAEIENRQSQLKNELVKLGVKIDTDTDVDVSNADRFKAGIDAMLKKLDKDYDPAKISSAKAANIAELRLKSEEIQSKIEYLQKEFDNYQQAYRKSLENNISIKYDHVIFGISAVAFGEQLDSDNVLTIGLAYVWSPKLSNSVEAALLGDATLDDRNIKGAESLDSWLDKQDLKTLGAFRYYVDNVGDRWFIGCGMAPNSVDESYTRANLNAIQNLYMPLSARINGLEEKKSIVRGGEIGKTAAIALEDVNKVMQSSSNNNTRGINQVASSDVAWPSFSIKTRTSKNASVAVSVVALNAKSAAAALKANVQGALAAAATEREHNRRILEQAQILNIVESAKKETPPSRVPELVGKTQPPSAQPNASSSTSSTADGAPKAKANSDDKLSPQPGMKVTPGKVQDDF